MARHHSIQPADRQFWQWVSHAAFANPFSDDRYELDRKIASRKFKDEAERGEFLREAVTRRVEKLERQGQAELRLYAGEDRELMRNVFLFETFHQFFVKLDEVILAQKEAGERLVPLPFAADALARLTRRGFSVSDAVRFLGIF